MAPVAIRKVPPPWDAVIRKSKAVSPSPPPRKRCRLPCRVCWRCLSMPTKPPQMQTRTTIPVNIHRPIIFRCPQSFCMSIAPWPRIRTQNRSIYHAPGAPRVGGHDRGKNRVGTLGNSACRNIFRSRRNHCRRCGSTDPIDRRPILPSQNTIYPWQPMFLDTQSLHPCGLLLAGLRSLVFCPHQHRLLRGS